ncbi:MAG: DUF749 family protein, partial [Thermoplasmata archaeon]
KVGYCMAYMARLLTITKFESVTDNIRPFVEFQAAQKKFDLKPDSNVVILQVEDIPSYHVIFPDSGITFDEIIKELEGNELTLSEDTKMKLIQLIQER